MPVKGTRLEDNFQGNPENGTYWKSKGGTWVVVTPNGYPGSLRNHTVRENPDGTITVEPSILVQDGQRELWHGYLVNGEWRAVNEQPANIQPEAGGVQAQQGTADKPQVPKGAGRKVEGMHLDGQELHILANGVGIDNTPLTAEQAQQTKPVYVNVQGPNGEKRELRFEQWRDRAQDASLEGWERVNDDGSTEPVGPTVAAPQRRTEGR